MVTKYKDVYRVIGWCSILALIISLLSGNIFTFVLYLISAIGLLIYKKWSYLFSLLVNVINLIWSILTYRLNHMMMIGANYALNSGDSQNSEFWNSQIARIQYNKIVILIGIIISLILLIVIIINWKKAWLENK